MNESIAKKPPLASSSTGSNLNKNLKNSLSFDDFEESFLSGRLLFLDYSDTNAFLSDIFEMALEKIPNLKIKNFGGEA